MNHLSLSILVVFYFGRFLFWLFSILVVFYFGRFLFCSFSILFVFYFVRFLFCSFSILVVFYFVRFLFWSQGRLQMKKMETSQDVMCQTQVFSTEDSDWGLGIRSLTFNFWAVQQSYLWRTQRRRRSHSLCPLHVIIIPTPVGGLLRLWLWLGFGNSFFLPNWGETEKSNIPVTRVGPGLNAGRNK